MEQDNYCLDFLGFDEVTEQTTIDYNLIVEDGNNLVSFNGIPLNNSLQNILGDQQDEIHFIIGQGFGAFHTDSNNDGLLDTWNGNLNSILPNKGYWVNVTLDSIVNLHIEDCFITPQNYNYELNWGNNLISYVKSSNMLYFISSAQVLFTHINL